MTSDNESKQSRLTDEMARLTHQFDDLILEAGALYYDEELAPTLRASGMPDAGIEALAENYRKGVATNAEAKNAIMRWLLEKPVS